MTPLRALWAAALVVAAIVAGRALNGEQLRAGLTDANPFWLLLAIAAHVAIQPLAAWQWRCLLTRHGEADVPFGAVLRAFIVGSVANNTLNSLLGHAAGTAAVARIPGVGGSRAVSMLLLDQLCVGLAKVTVLTLTLFTIAPLVWMRQGLIGLAGGVAALAVVLLVARRGLLPARLAALRPIVPMQAALAAVPPGSLAAAVLLALAVKGAEALGIAAVQLAFGLPVSVTSVLPVLAATAIASLVPVVPANVGPYEGAVFTALRLAGVPAERALVMAVVQHAVQLAAAVLPGLVWLRGGSRTTQRP